MEKTVFFNLSIANYHNGVKEFDVYRVLNVRDCDGESVKAKKCAKIIDFAGAKVLSAMREQNVGIRFVR